MTTEAFISFIVVMKRWLMCVFYFILSVVMVFLLTMRCIVASEGYPTWQAAHNLLVRDGKIVVRLPDKVKIVSAKCEQPVTPVQIEGQFVIVKIGHAWCAIEIDVEIDGKRETLYFNPQKLNNWNRIRYIPEDSSDPYSDFIKSENGVIKPANDYKLTYGSSV